MISMGTYRLRLETGHLMDLVDTCYIPTISRNLISLSRIDELWYYISFGSGKLSIFYDSIKVGSGILCDGLYRINLDLEFAKTLMTLQSNVGLKCSFDNEISSILWHRRLGHISKERIERLVKDNILEHLDFIDFDVCIDCIKGKQTKHYKKKCHKK